MKICFFDTVGVFHLMTEMPVSNPSHNRSHHLFACQAFVVFAWYFPFFPT